MKCKFCEEKEATLRLSICQFVASMTAKGVSIRREQLGGPTCAECMVRVLTEIPNAHFFAYRIDAPYQPDGMNYDDLLRMSVEDCAAYRHQAVAEFMRLEEKK